MVTIDSCSFIIVVCLVAQIDSERDEKGNFATFDFACPKKNNSIKA